MQNPLLSMKKAIVENKFNKAVSFQNKISKLDTEPISGKSPAAGPSANAAQNGIPISVPYYITAEIVSAIAPYRRAIRNELIKEFASVCPSQPKDFARMRIIARALNDKRLQQLLSSFKDPPVAARMIDFIFSCESYAVFHINRAKRADAMKLLYFDANGNGPAMRRMKAEALEFSSPDEKLLSDWAARTVSAALTVTERDFSRLYYKMKDSSHYLETLNVLSDLSAKDSKKGQEFMLHLLNSESKSVEETVKTIRQLQSHALDTVLGALEGEVGENYKMALKFYAILREPESNGIAWKNVKANNQIIRMLGREEIA